MLSFLPATSHGQRWNVPEHSGALLHVTIAALHETGNHALDELRLLLRLVAGGGGYATKRCKGSSRHTKGAG
jgi:hypothetical protein